RAMASANSSCSVKSESSSSGKVVAIKIHHLGPRGHKVFHKRLLRVGTCIDFREGSELGVRTEDEVDTSAGPLQLSPRAIASFEHVLGFRDSLPNRAHVEHVHE